MNFRPYLLKATVLLAGIALWAGSAAAAPLPSLVSALAGAPFAASAVDRPQADVTDPAELAPNLRRQLVDYSANVAPGTVIIDTAQTYLYFVLGDGKAIRYGIGVGREGFTWSGTGAGHAKGRVARLDPAGRDDRAAALSGALHSRR